jgi:hypothetical protein
MTTITDEPFYSDPRSYQDKLNSDERNWLPHKPAEECPETISGLVLERGTFTSNYDTDELIPTMRILSADNVEWSVIAFHGFLKSELDRKDPRPGDFIAIAYKGTKPSKKAGESDAHVYKVVVERNPNRAADDDHSARDAFLATLETTPNEDDEAAFVASLGDEENPFSPAA